MTYRNTWQVISIDECCEIIAGQHLGPQEYNIDRVGFPYLTGPSDFGLNHPAASRWTEILRAQATVDDILITVKGSGVGKINFGISAVIGRQLMALRPAPFLSKNFLFRWLDWRAHDLSRLGQGATIPGISKPALGRLEINIPPLAEQTRIVEKLEELLSDLDAGVSELKAAQKKLGQYRQSLLKAAVEGALTAQWRAQHTPTETGVQLLERILKERRARWEAKQLAKFEEQGKAPPKDWQKKYPEPVRPDTSGLPELPDGWVWASVDQLSPDDLANGRSVPSADNGAKVLRLTAMKDGWIDLNEYKHGDWSEEDAQQFAVTEGDILIVRGNGSLSLVGRAGLVGKVSTQVAYPDTMIRLRVVDAVVSPSWMGLVWRTRVVRSHIERRARTSAGIYKISQPDIVSAPIPVPPLAEQECIQQWLEQQSPEIDGLQSVLNSEIQRSAAQRKNILKAAFSGQLVSQDPGDEPAAVLLERIRAERAHASAPERKPRRGQTQESA